MYARTLSALKPELSTPKKESGSSLSGWKLFIVQFRLVYCVLHCESRIAMYCTQLEKLYSAHIVNRAFNHVTAIWMRGLARSCAVCQVKIVMFDARLRLRLCKSASKLYLVNRWVPFSYANELISTISQ